MLFQRSWDTTSEKALWKGAFTAPTANDTPSPKEEVIPEEEAFRYFAEQIGLPLKVVAGGWRPSTIAMYGFMMRGGRVCRWKDECVGADAGVRHQQTDGV